MNQHIVMRIIGPLFAALILLPLGFVPPARPVAAAGVRQPDAAALLAAMTEQEPNDTVAQAKQKPIPSVGSTWSVQISGKIGTSTDADYYAFTLAQPSSSVKISLENLPADYDLVLAADPDTGMSQGEQGVEDITGIGGTISAIGGTISAIGGTISAIGGTISAIGGTISAIGGTISAISANTGTAREEIDTFLWQPGTYYVAVGAANGSYSASSYTLKIDVKGSGLSKPAAAAPTVEMRVPTQANDISTLYVVNSARMNALYSGQSTEVLSITNQLGLLSFQNAPSFGGPPAYGYVLDLAKLKPTNGASPTLAAIYTEWDNNPGNPLYANKVAHLIDNLIKAAADPARNGQSCPPSPPAAAPACPAATMYYEDSVGTPANTQAPFPNVKYVVLVGGDNVIPFFRTPDLTTIANEADYAAYLAATVDQAGVIDDSKPQGAALKYRMTLSDNPYGTDKPLRFQGFPLFLPNRAVGRLVETPADIWRYLDKWQNISSINYMNPYTIDLRGSVEVPPQAYVNGYDFLQDEARAVSQTLSLGLGGVATPVIGGPINDSWTRSNLESSWFGSDLTAASPNNTSLGIFRETTANDPTAPTHHNEIFSLNSHFDHWQILPAKGAGAPGGTFTAQRILKPDYASTPGGYFGGALGYSVGCHSGYNVLDTGIKLSPANSGDAAFYGADFAQAFMRQAGSWIGNTGYGYGSADGIDYSERLSLYLTHELVRDVRFDIGTGVYNYTGAPIGAALAQAKQRYMRNVAGLSAYDAKSLTVMTLYGLPFIHVRVDNPLAPPPEEMQFNGPSRELAPNQSAAPISANSLGLLERTITVTISPGTYETVSRTLSKRLKLTAQNFSVEDSFVQAGFVAPTLRLLDNNQVGLPNLPAFAYDISARNQGDTARLQVRDVVFDSGEYALPIPFNPQITKVVTETDSPIIKTGDEPNFAEGAGVWYPAKFFGFSSVGQIVGTDDGQRDQLIATAAQFKANSDGVTGLLRSYKKMVFRVYYLDPSTAPEATVNDETAPTIQSVQISQIQQPSITAGSLAAAPTGGVTVVALVAKGGGTNIAGVSGVYVQDGTDWTPVTFENKGAPSDALQRWEAFIPLPPGQVRVIISATDAAGNVSYYTAKGTFSLGGSEVYLPVVRK